MPLIDSASVRPQPPLRIGCSARALMVPEMSALLSLSRRARVPRMVSANAFAAGPWMLGDVAWIPKPGVAAQTQE